MGDRRSRTQTRIFPIAHLLEELSLGVLPPFSDEVDRAAVRRADRLLVRSTHVRRPDRHDARHLGLGSTLRNWCWSTINTSTAPAAAGSAGA